MAILRFLCLSLMLTTMLACSHEPQLTPLHEGDVILAFGDSLTYGTGATLETSYPAYLSQLIGFQVINAGVPGEETEQGVHRIAETLDDNAPKLVIVCLGGNDLLRKRSPEVIKQNLENIINQIKARKIEVILIAVPEPKLSLHMPNFYRDIGKTLQIPVDTYTLRRLLSEPQYKSDYIHLNAQGYREMAINIASFLREHGAITTIKTIPR